MGIMSPSKQGKQNANQTSKQLGYQASSLHKEEFGSDYTYGNTKSQSQKKSGRQLNKRKGK